jgi:hypothetical protein
MLKAIIFDCFGVVITDAMQLVREELDAAIRRLAGRCTI